MNSWCYKTTYFGKRFNCWFSTLFNDWSSILLKEFSVEIRFKLVLCIPLNEQVFYGLEMWHPFWYWKIFIHSDLFMLFELGKEGVTLVVSEQVGLSDQVVESMWCDSWILSMLLFLSTWYVWETLSVLSCCSNHLSSGFRMR